MTGTKERLEQIEMTIRAARKFQRLQKDAIVHNQMSCILVALDEILDELKAPMERIDQVHRKQRRVVA